MNESVRARTRERGRKKNSASSKSNCQNNPEIRVKHYTTFARRMGIYFESKNRKLFDNYLILLHGKPSIVNMAFGICLSRPW